MANMIYPSVTKEGTQGFSKVWNKGGIAILLDDTAITFATDYANVVLRSFVDDQVKKYQEAQSKLKEEQAKSSLIVEA